MQKIDDFENKVAQLINRLPPMQSSVEHLLQSPDEKPQTTAEFIKLVKTDPSLCANLLHLANTFTSNSTHHDTTVEEAIKSVGTEPLIQLIGIWYANGIIHTEFASLEHLDDYFRHSQEISLGCRILAETTGNHDHDCEVSSIAGLIHDLGRLVILLAGDKKTASLMGTPWNAMKSIVEEERKILGMDHCQIGMQLCKQWNFSPYLQEGVLRHHSPLIGEDFNYLGAMIFTAHFLTSSDFTGQMLTEMLPDELIEKINLTKPDFKKAREEYFQRAPKLA